MIDSRFFALCLSLSLRAPLLTDGLLPEPETVRCGGFGREEALNLLAVTACIAEPSTDFPMSFGRSMAVGLGIRRFGPSGTALVSSFIIVFSGLTVSETVLSVLDWVVWGLMSALPRFLSLCWGAF